jgi:translation initiation factor IF-1
VPGVDVIWLEGKIVEVVRLAPKALFRVELANGHGMLAYAGRRVLAWATGLRVGDTVTVEVSPYDFSTGKLCHPDQSGQSGWPNQSHRAGGTASQATSATSAAAI